MTANHAQANLRVWKRRFPSIPDLTAALQAEFYA